MKKTLSTLILVLLMLSLFGCSAGAPAAENISSLSYADQYDLGVRYLTEGNYEEAVIAFTVAIEIDVKQASAWVGRGDAYVGLERYEEAAPDYVEALEIDETTADVYVKLADVYIVQGETEKAQELLAAGYAITEDEIIQTRLNELQEAAQPPEEFADELTGEQRELVKRLTGVMLAHDYQGANDIQTSPEFRTLVNNVVASVSEDEGDTKQAWCYTNGDNIMYVSYYHDQYYDESEDADDGNSSEDTEYTAELWFGTQGNGDRINSAWWESKSSDWSSESWDNYSETELNMSVVRYEGGRANGGVTEYSIYQVSDTHSDDEPYFDHGVSEGKGQALNGLKHGEYFFTFNGIDEDEAYTMHIKRAFDDQGKRVVFGTEKDDKGRTRYFTGVNTDTGRLTYGFNDSYRKGVYSYPESLNRVYSYPEWNYGNY